ncbi:MAG: DUF4254 domain-containing protein [Fuerstiella sp.]|nr:DUF4254 domain-containing protein [Fuerstiella sp.]
MDVTAILELHSELTECWHVSEPTTSGDGFLNIVSRNHLENFSLWHEEDIARCDHLGDERIRLAKRAIDAHNQRRNDLIEEMDRRIVLMLKPPESGCPFNSETPGMMIDRLSILALKRYHMQEEVDRSDATDVHREKCGTRLDVICRQITDLSTALTDLLSEIQDGKRSFRVYFQFKMYNDTELNPELRRAG